THRAVAGADRDQADGDAGQGLGRDPGDGAGRAGPGDAAATDVRLGEGDREGAVGPARDDVVVEVVDRRGDGPGLARGPVGGRAGQADVVGPGVDEAEGDRVAGGSGQAPGVGGKTDRTGRRAGDGLAGLAGDGGDRSGEAGHRAATGGLAEG